MMGLAIGAQMDPENEIQFFELNISKVNVLQQRDFLKSTHLKNYKHYLEQLFTMFKYLLSDKEEKIFNLISKTGYSNWVNIEDLERQIRRLLRWNTAMTTDRKSVV